MCGAGLNVAVASGNEDGRALQPAFAQIGKRAIGVFQRISLNVNVDLYLARQRENSRASSRVRLATETIFRSSHSFA